MPLYDSLLPPQPTPPLFCTPVIQKSKNISICLLFGFFEALRLYWGCIKGHGGHYGLQGVQRCHFCPIWPSFWPWGGNKWCPTMIPYYHPRFRGVSIKVAGFCGVAIGPGGNKLCPFWPFIRFCMRDFSYIGISYLLFIQEFLMLFIPKNIRLIKYISHIYL